MPNLTYLDFDLSVERSGDGYCARVLRSPCGEAEHHFTRPFSEIELRDFGSGVVRSRQGMRSANVGDIERVRSYGARLFDTVFGAEVHQCLLNSLHEARARPDTGLRIRLRLNGAPELAELPWEYLYRTSKRQFLALTTNTPIVRYLDLQDSARPVAVKPPLRILAMISSPTDADPLDAEAEWANLEKAVADLQARGDVVLHKLETATLDALRWQLREEAYHVFHFVGHAGYDPTARRGLLVLEDEQGRASPTSAEQLGVVLHEEDTLRLVVLNACEGGRTAPDDIFAGTAQTLVQKDVPAVVAMQFDISDTAAVTFARDFYRSLAYGDPVDTAVTQARQAIYARNELEWGTPVLYMRASEGRLFDVQPGALRGGAAAQAPPASPAGTPPSSGAPRLTPRAASTAERLANSGAAARELADLLGKARVAIGAEEWDRAIDTLNVVLARFAGSEEAFALLRRAREQKELATLYANAVRHEEGREWQQALACLHRLHTQAGGPYKDSEVRFKRVQGERARQISQQTEQAVRPAPSAPRTTPPVQRSAPPPQPTPAAPAAPLGLGAFSAPVAPARQKSHRLRDGIIGAVLVLVALTIIGVMVGENTSTESTYFPPPSPSSSLLQFDAAHERMALQGGQAQGQWVDQQIAQGQDGFQTITLTAGLDYAITSICDINCSDLDLTLRDAAGDVLGSDTAPDDTPVVHFTPTQNGEYYLTVRMAACSANVCTFATRLYAFAPAAK